MPTIVTASSIGTPTLQADSISDQAGSGSPTFPNGLNISGQNRLADGTVSVPSIAFTNSTTTGLFRKAANSVGFSAAGAEIGSFSATGAWTLGPAAGFTGTHSVRASLGVVDAGPGTNTPVFAISNNSQTATTDPSPAYLLFSCGNASTGAVTIGGVRTAVNSAKLVFGTHNNGSFLTAGEASAPGAWTLGPTGGATAFHTINQGIKITQISGSSQIQLERTGSSTGSVFLATGAGDFRIGTSAGVSNISSATSEGAWSLGDAARVSNNTVHSIFGSINIRTQSTNQNVIGHNVNRNGNSGIPDMRGSTAFGGVGIETALDTGSTFTRLRFISNTPGQSISLDGSIRGAMNAAGNWFFGTSGSGNVVSVNGVLAVRESANSGVGTAIFRNDSNGIAITTTADFDTGQNASCALVVVVNASNGQADLILKNGNSIVNISVGNIPSITYSIVNGAGSGSAIRITNNGVARAFRVSFLGSSSNDFGLTGIA